MSNIPPRQILLLKAGELFHKRGYAAVSVEDVIDASGLAKSTFYQNFSSKSKLGQAWLERLIKQMKHVNEGFLENPGDRDRRLRKYFFSMRSWLENSGYRSCQFANTGACATSEEDEELLDLIDEYKRSQRQFFIDLVGTLVAPEDAQRLGTAVFLLFSGAMTEAQNLKATWPMEDALATAESLCGANQH
ncbi:MAG: TetR/AcrR family transcriptional regulator [Opitutaceae bacterium]